MNELKKTRIIAAALTTALIAPGIAYAEDAVRSYQKTITVHYGIRVTKNGEYVDLIDSNGKKVDAFTYEDTAYVPLKTLAPLLGGTTQYTQENNTVNIFDFDESSFIRGYISAINGTLLSESYEKQLLNYGYQPVYYNQSSTSQSTASNSTSSGTSVSDYESFFMDAYEQQNDQYIELATEYYNMGSQRLDEITNDTAQNQDAWQSMYDALGEHLDNMAPTLNLPTSSNQNTNSQTADDIEFPLHLYSNDYKVYLGKCVTDEYDKDSIWYGLELAGDYSSPYSQTSIWNEYGEYGSDLISKENSAFNDKADTPPVIVDNKGKFVAYLTTNEKIEDGWTIAELRRFVENNNQ